MDSALLLYKSSKTTRLLSLISCFTCVQLATQNDEEQGLILVDHGTLNVEYPCRSVLLHLLFITILSETISHDIAP